MRQYIALGLWLASVDACVQPPLPPEPPIVMVISKCRGDDAGVTVQEELAGPVLPPETEAASQR